MRRRDTSFEATPVTHRGLLRDGVTQALKPLLALGQTAGRQIDAASVAQQQLDDVSDVEVAVHATTLALFGAVNRNNRHRTKVILLQL